MISPDQWIQDHYGAEIFRAGLEDLEKFLAPKLQLILQSKTKIITVAGTNGKGEVSHRLAQILKSKNCTYKMWTSPHLQTVTERFVSESGRISAGDLRTLFISTESQKITNLSYYEFLFSVFINWCTEELPEYLILEVGMGGRLDATSLLPASLVLIPSISRDHQDYLGPRYDQILSEKLGVMRNCREVSCFTSFELKYLREKLSESPFKHIEYFDLFEMGLVNKNHHYSLRNTILALAGISHLLGSKLGPEELKSEALVLLNSKIEGRGEQIQQNGKSFTFFGSHNPDGVRKLVHLLNQEHYTFKEVLVSFSARDQKDLITQLKLICLLGKEKIVLTSFSHPKAASSEVLELLAKREGIRFVKEWTEILQSDKPTCLVTGSYYFVGAVQSYLSKLR